MKYVYKIGGIVIFFILIISILPTAFADLNLTHEVEKHTYLNKTYEDSIEDNEYLHYQSSVFSMNHTFSVCFWFESDFNLTKYDSYTEGLLNIFECENYENGERIASFFNYKSSFLDKDYLYTTNTIFGLGHTELYEENNITGKKIHITMTKNDDYYKFFVNGEIIEESPLGWANSYEAALRFGETTYALDAYTDTYYSELYFFNRTLNSTEINEGKGDWDNSSFQNYTDHFNLWNKTKLGDTNEYYDYTNSVKNGTLGIISNEVWKERRIIDTWVVVEQYILMKNIIFIILILLSIAVILKMGELV